MFMPQSANALYVSVRLWRNKPGSCQAAVPPAHFLGHLGLQSNKSPFLCGNSFFVVLH